MLVGEKNFCIAELLKKDRICVDLKAENKIKAITQLTDTFRVSKEVLDFDLLLKDLVEREALCTTGIGNEIAVPHARTEGVNEFIIALARVPEGVDFNSPDGKAIKLIFLIVNPKDQGANEYLKILARLTRFLQKEPFRQALIGASSAKEMIDLFRKVEGE